MATARLNVSSVSTSASMTKSAFDVVFAPVSSDLSGKNFVSAQLYGYVVGVKSKRNSTVYDETFEDPTNFYSDFGTSGSSMSGWVSTRNGYSSRLEQAIIGIECHISPRVYAPGSAYTVISDGGMYTGSGSNAPYLIVEYVDPIPKIKSPAPSGGFVPKYEDTIFSWGIANDADGVRPAGELVQSSGTFKWRDGTSGTIKSVDVGSEKKCTIPAGTFTTDTIQWCVTVTVEGQTLTSDWYTLTTKETTSTVSLISPVSGFLNSEDSITFIWDHIISTGTAQTGFDLQTSTDGVEFTTLFSGNSAAENITFPANTFDAGKLYWRVRTYNTDDNPGEWSPAAQVTVIGAPAVPIVTLDDTSPRPSVRWQSSGQQGYEVQIDGLTVERAFGVTKSYRSEAYLSDGQHSIRVRVQNKYGLWSDFGSVSVQISNLMSFLITLNAYGGNEATLNWTTSGGYDKFYVYRDGELIAKTTDVHYEDVLTNGTHRYYVRGAYDSSGEYGLSNEVSVVVRPETTTISTVDGTISIELPYSETNNRSTTLDQQRRMSTMYFAGSDLPSMEISEWTDRKITISAALKPVDDIAQIMSLIGKTVCVRDQHGNCVIGVLPGWTVRNYEMYTVIQTTIQDINWRETIKHDPIT